MLCECTEVSCSLTLSLSPEEYERIRSSPTQFVVRPDHALRDGERIVHETPEYAWWRRSGRARPSRPGSIREGSYEAGQTTLRSGATAAVASHGGSSKR